MKKNYLQDIESYFERLKSTIDRIPKENISEVMNVLEDARESGRNIFIMGNGGSAATASHFVCDFNKGVSFDQEKKYRFLCLNDNIPSLMAYGNDISYEDIFVHPLKNYFQEGDVVIGISGSGNSENVVRAVEYANANGGVTVSFTGYDGGRLAKMTRHGVNIPIHDMQISEDLHMVLDHCMMKILSGKNC